MIIPIGHEQSEVRRLPWVTIAIMAICVLALLATDPTGRAADEPVSTPIEQAADYWRDRPYLDAPPEVLTEVGYDVAPNQRKQYIGLLRTNAAFSQILDDTSYNNFAIMIGGGLNAYFTDNLGLRADIRYYRRLESKSDVGILPIASNFDFWRASLAFNIRFF